MSEQKELISLPPSKNLSDQKREELLLLNQQIIEDSLHAIQMNFFRIGKALAIIKNYKLYKADKLYPKWRDYVNNRIYPKVHQSTVSDYIGIVRMQLENDDFIGEDELILLGIKKARLLKSKYNLITQIKDKQKRNLLLEKFKDTYRMSFEEMRDVPFIIFKKKLDDLIQTNIKTPYIERIEKDRYEYLINKKTGTLSLKIKDESMYYKLDDLSKKIESLIQE